MSTIGIRVSEKPQGRRLVVGDIHGCIRTFRKMVEDKLKLEKHDHLFLLGDYLDRGPDSGAVLDYIFSLQEFGFSVFPLKGNHEAMFLESYRDYEPAFFQKYLKFQKCYGMLNEEGQVPQAYLDFMRGLPYYYELEDYYLVHAGFDFEKEKPFENTRAMLWIRFYQPDPEACGGRIIVHGHTPQPWKKTQLEIEVHNPTICLDTGCVYIKPRKMPGNKRESLAHLSAMDLDSRELFVLENQEGSW